MGEVSYKGHRYPAEIIAHCVWLYHRLPLSFREVEELMLVRGVIVTYETIRQWCAKFGPVFAGGLRRRQPLYTTSLQRSRSSILPHLTFPAHQPDSALRRCCSGMWSRCGRGNHPGREDESSSAWAGLV